MGWLISLLCLVTGVALGWGWRGRQLSHAAAAPAAAATDEPTPAGPGWDAVLDDIRNHLSDKFDQLTSLVELLEQEETSADEELLSQTKQLTDDLAGVYDDIRRFGDRSATAGSPNVDEITGLGNRQALEGWLDTHYAYLARYGNDFSVVLCSYDLPSAANDQPSITSRRLCDFAELLRSNVRDTDHVFRYSDHEFVVTLPETPLAGAMVFARRVVAAANSTSANLQVRAGVATAQHTDSLRCLLKRADAALYQTKAEPGQSVCYHDGSKTGSVTDDTPHDV